MLKKYDIIAFTKHVDADGQEWFEAISSCGAVISASRNISGVDAYYEIVVVENGAVPGDLRMYAGNECSEAHATYLNVSEGYTHASYGAKIWPS